MIAALVLLLFALVPTAAGGQPAQAPPTSPPSSTTDVDPRTPPPQTIPSRPEILFPVSRPVSRPVQMFEFHPLFGVSEEYTDNFNRTVNNRQDNFRSTLAPGMNVLLDAGFLTGQATYTFSGFYDTAVSDFGYFNTFAGGLVWEATPRIRLNVSGDVSQNDEPLQADTLGLRQVRRQFTTSHASVGSDLTTDGITASPYYRFSNFSDQAGPDTTTHSAGTTVSTSFYRIHLLTLGYEYLTSRTVDGTAGAGESETHGHQFSGSFSRDISERTTLGVSGGYTFRTQTDLSSDTETKYYRWNAFLFDNYVLPNKIVLRANVGVTQLSTQTSTGDPLFSTFSSLSYWFGETVATATVERGYVETFATGQNQGVVLTTGGGISIVSPFTPSLRGHADVAYHHNEFTGIGGVPAPSAIGTSPTRTENVLRASVGLRFQMLRWLSSTLQYTYSRTESSGTIFENRVRLSLDFAF